MYKFARTHAHRFRSLVALTSSGTSGLSSQQRSPMCALAHSPDSALARCSEGRYLCNGILEAYVSVCKCFGVPQTY